MIRRPPRSTLLPYPPLFQSAEADAAHAAVPKIHPTREGDGMVLDHPHFVQYVRQYLDEKFAALRDPRRPGEEVRSEEHTSELQSRQYLACRLLLEKKTYSPT